MPSVDVLDFPPTSTREANLIMVRSIFDDRASDEDISSYLRRRRNEPLDYSSEALQRTYGRRYPDDPYAPSSRRREAFGHDSFGRYGNLTTGEFGADRHNSNIRDYGPVRADGRGSDPSTAQEQSAFNRRANEARYGVHARSKSPAPMVRPRRETALVHSKSPNPTGRSRINHSIDEEVRALQRDCDRVRSPDARSQALGEYPPPDTKAYEAALVRRRDRAVEVARERAERYREAGLRSNGRPWGMPTRRSRHFRR
jgi:hypothetical protein